MRRPTAARWARAQRWRRPHSARCARRRRGAPRGVRKLTHHARRRVGQVERDEAEAPRLQDEIGGLQRARRIPDVADPQQFRQVEPHRVGRLRVEPIVRIDQGDRFAARGGGGQRPVKNRGASRRARADELGQVPAGPSTAERQIERVTAGRRRIARRRLPGTGGRERDVQMPGPEERFEVCACGLSHCFAFCSPLQRRV
jgi:hypothetical protein